MSQNQNKPANVIKPDGDDYFSRVSRVNDLVLTSHIRLTTNLGLKESHLLVKVLRGASFDVNDNIVVEYLKHNYPDDRQAILQRIEAGLQNAFDQIQKKNHLGMWQV